MQFEKKNLRMYGSFDQRYGIDVVHFGIYVPDAPVLPVNICPPFPT